MKKEKKFYQKWWFWVITFVVVVSIGNAITRPGRIKDLNNKISNIDMSDTSSALLVLDSLYMRHKIDTGDTDFGPLVKEIKSKMISLGKDPDYVAPKTSEEILRFQLSAWDGSLPPLVDVVKEAMHDPDSYDHSITTYLKTKNDSTDFLITMEYRGNNAFGAKVKNKVRCIYNIKTRQIRDVRTVDN